MRLRTALATAIFALAGTVAQASVNSSLDARAQTMQPQSGADAYKRALVYSKGDAFVKSDPARALLWLRRAAALGHGEAQYRLAAVYSRGAYGVSRNDALVFAWLRRSAMQGFAEAQYALGLRYAEGNGVPRDALKALAWIAKAAKNGHREAMEAMQRAGAAHLPTR